MEGGHGGGGGGGSRKERMSDEQRAKDSRNTLAPRLSTFKTLPKTHVQTMWQAAVTALLLFLSF